MREQTREFCRLAAQYFEFSSPIVEFGSRIYEAEQTDSNLRPFFGNLQYIGCDMLAGPGVDRIEDLGRLSFPDNSVPAVLCIETMEHVFHIEQAFREIYRVLRPGGLFAVTSPFNFRIHAYPDDYWRMTPACLDRLLEAYAARLSGYQGTRKFPHTVFGLAAKHPVPADFSARAALMVEQFQGWLAGQARAMPLRRRLRRWLGPLRATKAERERMSQEFQADFTIKTRTTQHDSASPGMGEPGLPRVGTQEGWPQGIPA